MSDPASPNVISLTSRKPLAYDQALKEVEQQNEAEIREVDQRNCLGILEDAALLIGQGRLTGVIVLGLDPITGLFFNQIRLDGPNIETKTLFAYIGQLQTTMTELSAAAMMAPYIDRKGEIVNPEVEPQLEGGKK